MHQKGVNAGLVFICSSLLLAIFLYGDLENVRNALQSQSNLSVRTSRQLTSTGGTATMPQKLWVASARLPGISDRVQDKYKENVQNTINKYKAAWNVDNVEVETLTTEKCREAISKIPIKGASTDLLNYFNEKSDPSHVCPIAVLFLHGGYFIQEEVEVLQAYIPSDDETSFVAVTDKNGLFNASFLASSQYHPLLYRVLKKYISFVKGELQLKTGSSYGELMLSSYREVTAVNPDQKSDFTLLTEEDLGVLQQRHDGYKQVARQDGEGPFCNYAIVDDMTKKTYFFTRFPGAHAHHCDVVVTNKVLSEQVAQEPALQKPALQKTPETSNIVINTPAGDHRIPHILWFATRFESSRLQKEDNKHYQNIIHTVDAYKSAWGTDNVEFKILDHRSCMNAIVKLPMTGASSALFDFYLDKSKQHPMKGFDICRAAILYQYGGYFFNEEVEVIEPYTSTRNDVTFVGVRSQSGLFLPAFVASIAEHPILQEVLSKFIMLALNKIQVDPNLSGGEEIYRDAHNIVGLGKSVILSEKHLEALDDAYEKKSKRSHKCSYVIYSLEEKKIHFYTRMFIDGEYCIDEVGN